MNYKDFFTGKKITIMGLGLLGRGVGVAKFLAELGAELTITDLKNEEQLASSLEVLSPYKNIKYVLGRHEMADFKDRDMVIKAAGVPLNSPYVAEAKKNDIPVEMDASLFAKLSTSNVDMIGVTGTRGKSTVTQLVYEILKADGREVFLGGNVRGLATLPLLNNLRRSPTSTQIVVVMELDSWQLQGFGDAGISPHISIFTSFMRDHQNYYKGDMDRYFADKVNIFKFQKENDFLICEKKVSEMIRNKNFESAGNVFAIGKDDVKNSPIGDWKIKLLGEHNLINIALAVKACEALGIDENVIKKTVENFSGVPGRLEFVREVSRVKFYNDTTATTPDAAIAAIKTLCGGDKPSIVLIGGGADKELDFKEYIEVTKDKIKALALFKGAATDKIVDKLGKVDFPVEIFDNMKDAFGFAVKNAESGDIVLLSPGAASFGVFKNEFDRGEQFEKEVNKITI